MYRVNRESNLHPLELDLAFDVSGEVGLDVGEVGDLVDVRRGSDEVGALDEFQAGFLQADAGCVEGASLVGEEDDALELVDLDEELELVDHALLLQRRLRVPRQTRRPPRQRHPVIPGQPQPLLQQVVEVLAEAAVGAVDRRGVDAGGFVGKGGDVGGRGQWGMGNGQWVGAARGRGSGVGEWGGRHVDLDGAARTGELG